MKFLIRKRKEQKKNLRLKMEKNGKRGDGKIALEWKNEDLGIILNI